MSDAFYQLYTGLDREGPGAAEDVAWALELAGVKPDARICDAGCGTGGDIPALLEAVPEGHVTALDKQRSFVDEVLARYGDHPRVTAYRGDIAKLKGPFDLIWCAGAIYFLGLTKALRVWRPALRKGGAVVFSKPALFVDDPSDKAQAFWGEFPARPEAEIVAEVEKLAYRVLGTRRLSDAAWERYYQPLEARIALLKAEGGTSPELAAVLAAARVEIDTWRQVKEETGYLLVVAQSV